MSLENDELRHISLNRKTAYTGEIGRRRRQFCLDYTAYKKTALAQEEKLLHDKVTAEGETISCKKGCSACCTLYVTASLQEAECLTWYLYQHEAALQHFLSAYRTWRQGLGMVADKLPLLDEMVVKNISGNLSAAEQEQLDSYVNEYTGRQAPCPFLIENACSIYEVRPFACGGVVAVTPPELCSLGNSGVNPARYLKIEINLDEEMPYFARTLNPILIGSLPELVHVLLVQGYSFLSCIEGLEEFRHSIPGQPTP